jgi:O-antigen/teichoic acid export membrane protein
MGVEFAEKGRYVIILLSLSLFAPAIQPLSGRLLTGTSRQGVLIRAGFLSAAIFLGAGVILIGSYGLPGLAASFLLGSLTPSFFVLRKALSVLGISMTDYFRKSVCLPVAIGFVSAIFLWSIKRLHYPDGYFDISLQAFSGILLFTVLSFGLCLERGEKAFIIDRFGMRRKIENLVLGRTKA